MKEADSVLGGAVNLVQRDEDARVLWSLLVKCPQPAHRFNVPPASGIGEMQTTAEIVVMPVLFPKARTIDFSGIIR
jgi:hypothetical protein